MGIYTLLDFRVAASFLLTLSFGYIAPCLNTVKAILDRDANAVKEYLTYWVVFLIAVYLGRALKLLSSVHQNHPPELKVLFILWLTLPRFHGALRIYLFVLKPYFEKYEDHIDVGITKVATEVHSRASRHIKLILWQLFFAPNDGVLTAAISGVNTLIGNKREFSWPNFLNPHADVSHPTPVAPTVDLSSAALSRQLLTEFSKLLTDGMYLEVWRGSDEDILPCELQLLGDSKRLGISTACGSDDGTFSLNQESDDQDRTVSNPPSADDLSSVGAGASDSDSRERFDEAPEDVTIGRSSEIATAAGSATSRRLSRRRVFTTSRHRCSIDVRGDTSALKFPLALVVDVSADSEESLVVSISVPVDILSPAACLAFAGMLGLARADLSTTSTTSTTQQCRTATLCLLAEGLEEAETLQVGLQLLVRAAKTELSRAMLRILRSGNIPRRAMRSAFVRWRGFAISQELETALSGAENSAELSIPRGLEVDDDFDAAVSARKSRGTTPLLALGTRRSSRLAASRRFQATASDPASVTEDSEDDYGSLEHDDVAEPRPSSPDIYSREDIDEVRQDEVLMEADMDDYYFQQILLSTRDNEHLQQAGPGSSSSSSSSNSSSSSSRQRPSASRANEAPRGEDVQSLDAHMLDAEETLAGGIGEDEDGAPGDAQYNYNQLDDSVIEL